MKRIRLWPTCCLLFSTLCIAMAGCGDAGDKKGGDNKGGSTAGSDAGSVATYSLEDLNPSIGEYMPPQEHVGLKIAAPRGWEWGRAGPEYLVGFYKKDSALKNLPRILVSVEDSPFPGLNDVNKTNVDELVKRVSESVDAKKLKGTVEPIILGNTACARYVELGRMKNALAAVQTLKTVAGGRLYTIRLETYDKQFGKYRDMGYAVAASMKFGGSGSPGIAANVGEDAEPSDPSDAAPKTDPEQPAEPATPDSE